MIKIFSKFKIIFYFTNFCLIFLYLFPGSLFGMIIYGNKSIQPQITPDFFISSNHFYVFCLISIIGFMSYLETKKNKYLIIFPAFSASNFPCSVRSTSTQPVNLFSRFQILCPCLTKIKKLILLFLKYIYK